MEKLEKILCILAFTGAAVAFTGVALEKRAIIYEKDRTIERGIFYGGAVGAVASIFGASYAYSRNNRKKKNPNRNYERTKK